MTAATRPQTRNDARVWASMIPVLRGAGVAEPETVSRALVAVMRREDRSAPGIRATGLMEACAQTFAPGEGIPAGVDTVYDLDGSLWDRWTLDSVDIMRDSWRMRDYDPDDHEAAAAGVYTTPHLLTGYGPLTHAAVPWQGGPGGQ